MHVWQPCVLLHISTCCCWSCATLCGAFLIFFRVFRLLDSNTHHSQAACRSSNSYLGWITTDLCMCKLPVPFICEQWILSSILALGKKIPLSLPFSKVPGTFCPMISIARVVSHTPNSYLPKSLWLMSANGGFSLWTWPLISAVPKQTFVAWWMYKPQLWRTPMPAREMWHSECTCILLQIALLSCDKHMLLMVLLEATIQGRQIVNE